MKTLALSLILVSAASMATSDVEVRFIESAPKDSFVILNQSGCDLLDVTVEIDLGESQAGLILDVTGAGAGVEVFQPLEVVAGVENLTSVPQVQDGDTMIVLPFREFAAGESVRLTIDVDDTAGAREITVTDDEISGAQVAVFDAQNRWSATFGGDAVATVEMAVCDV